jgi:hypothetical protein
MRSILLTLLPILAAPALASDGVLEINQTCAVETGCFSGDTAGFPVTIDGSAGSSYLLTSDLSISDANTTAVMIDASFTTVNLGGHRVKGPVTCTGATPIVCAPTGTGRGVVAGGVAGVRIRNGTITGMADVAVGVNFNGSVESVISAGNGGIGIFAGPGSSIERSKVTGNGGDGISGVGKVSAH